MCTATRTSSYSLVGSSVFFCVFSLGLCFVYSFLFLWFVCLSPFFYVSLGSWVISLIVFGASVTNLNEPSRALATSTIAWVRSYSSIPFGPLWTKQRGLRGLLYRWPSITEWEVHITAQAPPVSETTYTVSSGTLTLLYHAIFSEFNSGKMKTGLHLPKLSWKWKWPMCRDTEKSLTGLYVKLRTLLAP